MPSSPKRETYKLIKIAGFILFIPIVLTFGPIGGLFIGEYLKSKFGLPSWVTYLCIFIGFIVSIKQTINIIKTAIKLLK